MDFIIDTTIDIDKKVNIPSKIQNDDDIQNLIEAIILQIRQEYFEIYNDLENLENRCDLFQALSYYYFRQANFLVYPVETQQVISSDVWGHSLLYVTFNNKEYLIDLTYKQFFLKRNCQKSNYLLDKNANFILLSPHPGYYYVLNPDKLNVAKQLLENGYLPATVDNLKIYFDSFYLTRKGRILNKTIPTQSNIGGNIYAKMLSTGSFNLSYSVEDLKDQGFSLKLDK